MSYGLAVRERRGLNYVPVCCIIIYLRTVFAMDDFKDTVCTYYIIICIFSEYAVYFYKNECAWCYIKYKYAYDIRLCAQLEFQYNIIFQEQSRTRSYYNIVSRTLYIHICVALDPLYTYTVDHCNNTHLYTRMHLTLSKTVYRIVLPMKIRLYTYNMLYSAVCDYQFLSLWYVQSIKISHAYRPE